MLNKDVAVAVAGAAIIGLGVEGWPWLSWSWALKTRFHLCTLLFPEVGGADNQQR